MATTRLICNGKPRELNIDPATPLVWALLEQLGLTGTRIFLTVLFCLFALSSAGFAKEKPAIVLVHGAFQDAPCTWSKVEPELKAKGFKVLTVNLPGRGSDQADPSKLITEDYKQAVLNVISAQTQPVILVGHSFGGITISNVAEATPDKIKALIYLSAYLPKDGDSLQSLSQTDADSKLGQDGNFVVSPDYKYASVKPEHFADLFGNDATGDAKEAIGRSLIREPLAPMANPVKLTPERFGSVPKYYMETTRDVVVSRSLQERMIKQGDVKNVFRIDAGHASYITQPHAVAQAIASVAGQQ